MLPKKNRLSNKAVISKAFSKGVKIRGKYGMFVAMQSNDPTTPLQLCIVAKKVLGDAHIRNKARRRVSCVIQTFIKTTPLQKIILVYVIFTPAENYSELKSELVNQLSYINQKLGERNIETNNKAIPKNTIA